VPGVHVPQQQATYPPGRFLALYYPAFRAGNQGFPFVDHGLANLSKNAAPIPTISACLLFSSNRQSDGTAVRLGEQGAWAQWEKAV